MSEHDSSVQSAQRRAKLAQLRAEGDPYPNDFKRDGLAADLQRRFGDRDQAALEAAPTTVTIAGRMMTRRVMGKAAFVHLQDMSGRIQLYLRREVLGEGCYEAFKDWDIGDIIGATGSLFKTKTGELSVAVQSVRLLAKSLHPLPEKFHGLSDVETRYRQRYLDLIMSEASRRVFERRS
ncbi:MAG: OB-fold nucleic acid binding domain-containing protein, partial [Gammaproteobacteria bacterium]